jgi:outer membrane protein assembly factor BamB
VKRPPCPTLVLFVFFSLFRQTADAGDWPMWRANSARDAVVKDELPNDLSLRWILKLPTPRPAWPASQPSLRFDESYSPVVAGKMLYVPSMATDSVTAHDTETGERRWRVFAQGPVRFAPAVADDKLYFVSDDGFLYCLDANTGRLHWKYNGAPYERNLLGNERMISTWPARGGPVVRDGVVYFTSGVWPFMGVFAHAVDAASGKPIWMNSGFSDCYAQNPHSGAISFSYFVPRGYLAMRDGKLIAPGGRTPPGTFDLATGQLIDFQFDKKGNRGTHGAIPIKAGSRQFAPGNGEVSADGFRAKVDGEVWSMLAADDKLFVVTKAGSIHCFGSGTTEPIIIDEKSVLVETTSGSHWKQKALQVLRESKKQAGYCIVLGISGGQLAEVIARNSNLHVVVLDADPREVDAFRHRMADAGLYGSRIAAYVGEFDEGTLPRHFAELIIAEHRVGIGQDTKEFDQKILDTLRPYGGVAYLPEADGSWRVINNDGPLPGAADWTHNYGDAGNSVVSQDSRVRAPLGLLWFGNGPPNDEVLPRHGHGPAPQVAAGRLVIEGADMLRATDIYTGHLLWQRGFPGLGEFHNHTGHQPGAGEIGGNYVTLDDSVYVVYGSKILRLDAATGETLAEYALPPGATGDAPRWGAIAVSGDILVATSSPVTPGTDEKGKTELAAGGDFETIIRRGATWSYFAGGDAPEGWMAVGFDDSKWPTGKAGFGYGDDDDATEVAVRGDTPRMYVRTTFEQDRVRDANKLVLAIRYDDAFVAYLNGEEIIRAGVERGSGKDAQGIRLHEAKAFDEFPIRDFQQLLRAGENVLAIEGHNANATSSDFSLHPTLLTTRKATEGANEKSAAKVFVSTPYSSASRRLVAMDRISGDVRWSREAKYNFRHNNVAIGGGKVFCIDGLSKAKLEKAKRRGIAPDRFQPRLLALDLATGEEVWSTSENVFGTFLNYSRQHDVLLQAGSAYRDRANDETRQGMVACRGKDGRVIWRDLERKHAGPCILHEETIIAQGPGYSLLTGAPVTREHPLTGKSMPWSFTRKYGCNTTIASRNLLTFRSGAAGYFDLERDGGTGNLGGFKSSCTSNLVVAGGLLNAPEYTRTCVCNYQNQTSLALLHDPRVETWTFQPMDWDGSPVERVGINFGAPGDRRADDGTLWLDYPSVGGESPDLPIKIEGSHVRYFRIHSAWMKPQAESLTWVGASGVLGAQRISLTLAKDDVPRRCTVRLHFAEIMKTDSQSRTFDVLLQGLKVLEGFDLLAEAGERGRVIVREFNDVEVIGELDISLKNTGKLPTVLCGIEVVEE